MSSRDSIEGGEGAGAPVSGGSVAPAPDEPRMRLPVPPVGVGDIVRIKAVIVRGKSQGAKTTFPEAAFRAQYGFPKGQLFLISGVQKFSAGRTVFVLRWPGHETLAKKTQVQRMRMPKERRIEFLTEVALGIIAVV